MSKTLLDEQIKILETNQAAWEAYAETSPIEDFTPQGATGITKKGISKAFQLIIKELKLFDLESNPFVTQTLITNLPSWTSPMLAWIQSVNSSPSVVSNIFSHLNAIASQFSAYAYFSEKELSPKQISKMANEHTNLLKQVNQLKLELNDLLQKKTLLDEALVSTEAIKAIKASAEADASVAGAHRESIEQSKILAEGYLKSISNFTESIPEYEAESKVLLSKSDEVFKEAQKRLDFASREGMAYSFRDRAKEYVWPRRGWLVLFVISLAGIVGIGSYFIVLQDSTTLDVLAKLPKIVAAKESTNLSINAIGDNYSKLINSLKFIPLSLPFVWLAWFSALKFSQLGRLREDYQFKVATALALDGYRRQVAEVNDPKLAEKLLDLAITNFGENPLRLLTKDSAKDAHPLAGIIDEKGWSEVLKEGLQSIANKVGK
jgi:hypothetical protein